MHRHHLLARPALRAPGRALRGWTALLLAGVTSLSGCYAIVPLAGAPSPGSTLVLDLNDRGRLALGDSIGRAAETIQGEVTARSDSAYVLRVESVRYLNGQSNRWSGEPLAVRMDLVGRARERQFSRKRTLGAALGTVAAILAVALTTDLFGTGDLPREGPTPPPGQTQ
jgi:hypothetical protein